MNRVVDRKKVRDLVMSTLMLASDYHAEHPYFRDPVVLDESLLDRMKEKTAFTTAPRVGNDKDYTEFIVGRDVYYALTTMLGYTQHLSSNPEVFVKAGAPVLYKGLSIVTDAMLIPEGQMLPPNSILCICTRRNGSLVITRPCAVLVDIPCLEQDDVVAPMDYRKYY